jgi:hypothetical protein
MEGTDLIYEGITTILKERFIYPDYALKELT